MMLRLLWPLLAAGLLLYAHTAVTNGEPTFDPFSDALPYMVVWPGQAPATMEEAVGNGVLLSTRVRTVDNENYVCTHQQPRDSNKAQMLLDYTGPSPEDLLRNFFALNSCSYRIESYWAYELCHGRHFKQYHETKDATSATGVTSIEYFLGFHKGMPGRAQGATVASASGEAAAAGSPPTIRFDGEDVAYFEVLMEGGTVCDLSGAPRRTSVLYVCHPDGRGELYELMETSSCEYRVIVLTAALCQHPAYRKDLVESSIISCYALSGSPARPRSLVAFEGENERWRPYNKPNHKGQQPVPKAHGSGQEGEDEEEEEDNAHDGADKAAPATEPASTPLLMPEGARTDVGSAADEALLIEFLSGSYCIQGGSGWWQHEFCFGRHALQYHVESGGRRSDIVLGRWHEDEHLEWLRRNPGKRPKPRDKRKTISLFHTNGDICDLTGKPRVVEVKLKCAVNAGSSHYVSVYLLEPKTCEYIMTIESPILCKVVAQADDSGIFLPNP